MFGFGKKFGRKVKEVQSDIKKMENRDLLEAIVAGGVLVASADGDISSKELMSLEKIIAANPSLSHFGNEVTKTIQRFKIAMEAGFRSGKLQCLRDISDVKNEPRDVEDVMNLILEIAEASGDIDEKEMKVLNEIAQTLGCSLRDYGFDN